MVNLSRPECFWEIRPPTCIKMARLNPAKSATHIFGTTVSCPATPLRGKLRSSIQQYAIAQECSMFNSTKQCCTSMYHTIQLYRILCKVNTAFFFGHESFRNSTAWDVEKGMRHRNAQFIYVKYSQSPQIDSDGSKMIYRFEDRKPEHLIIPILPLKGPSTPS